MFKAGYFWRDVNNNDINNNDKNNNKNINNNNNNNLKGVASCKGQKKLFKKSKHRHWAVVRDAVWLCISTINIAVIRIDYSVVIKANF